MRDAVGGLFDWLACLVYKQLAWYDPFFRLKCARDPLMHYKLLWLSLQLALMGSWMSRCAGLMVMSVFSPVVLFCTVQALQHMPCIVSVSMQSPCEQHLLPGGSLWPGLRRRRLTDLFLAVAHEVHGSSLHRCLPAIKLPQVHSC